ncbi:FG-GAP-like repeat-containing protein [Gimesia panareensis]|uniref:FG-GAP repeat protein n=1 Tax=Gimesia panareensis TaxID=2527978 RepID=A0A517ZZX2_9PLAN|nr:FG-GAP-like repeat-containing protein [Gimesia panareensis]QDT25038.1 FG-GAP repeat protein [Gimesia panareensis]QDU48032.1 FG-GAP repeat protein [Gimesia panareensis]
MPARCCSLLFLTLLLSCGKQESSVPPSATLTAESRHAEFETEIKTFCGHCHLCPDPDVLTQDAWRMQIPREYVHYEQSTEKNLRVPPMPEVIRYFVDHAPTKHQLPAQIADVPSGPVHFERQSFPRQADDPLPGVTNLNWVSGNKLPGELLLTDLDSGRAGRIRFSASQPEFESLAKLHHPAHIERVDLNGDQHDDYLIADLGSFGPEDHDRGTVEALLFDPQSNSYQQQTLQAGLGRVADAKAADFDADGDLDLIVAEFGWHKTGRLLYLENVSKSKADLQYQLRVLDPRHGASHVLITDWNQDGLPDFVTLFSQEHEIIVAFLNEGQGRFRTETIYQAPDPAYGSSCIELVDLDQDGDLDLLYTNGDTMDSFELRPSHSVQWLENRGRFPFEHHRLAPLTGAYGVTHGDFDNDGDIDLAACTMTWNYDQRRNTIVWYEQTAPGQFTAHPLDYSYGQHPVLTAGDFDGDGNLDLAVGNFEARAVEQVDQSEWFSLWWNKGSAKSKQPAKK